MPIVTNNPKEPIMPDVPYFTVTRTTMDDLLGYFSLTRAQVGIVGVGGNGWITTKTATLLISTNEAKRTVSAKVWNDPNARKNWIRIANLPGADIND
jgi:hypothetical protein